MIFRPFLAAVVAIAFLLPVGCQPRQSTPVDEVVQGGDTLTQRTDSLRMVPPDTTIAADTMIAFKPEVLETFCDSTHLGKRGRFKIDITLTEEAEHEMYSACQFFKKENNQWQLIQSFRSERVFTYDLFPEFTDINNDGFKDLTFRQTEAARGSNDIRHVFLFDNISGTLHQIRKTEEYPNLVYDPVVKGIVSEAFWGDCIGFTLLQIQGDSLREIVLVDSCYSYFTVYETDRNGNRITVRHDTTNLEKLSAGEFLYRYRNRKAS